MLPSGSPWGDQVEIHRTVNASSMVSIAGSPSPWARPVLRDDESVMDHHRYTVVRSGATSTARWSALASAAFMLQRSAISGAASLLHMRLTRRTKPDNLGARSGHRTSAAGAPSCPYEAISCRPCT